MKHKQQHYVKQVIQAGLSPLLMGESGTGKSTIAKSIADELNLQFYAVMGTAQLSVGQLLGFTDVNGNYSPTSFRQAIQSGGIFAIEELTAVDANVILCLNSIDNGFVPFPDQVVDVHPDFHLIATANPVTEQYGARRQLDFSTINRYYSINIEHDDNLAVNLSSPIVIEQVQLLRDFLTSYGSSIQLTMRDEIKLQKLINLGLDDQPVLRLIDTESQDMKDAALAFFEQHASTQAELLAKQKADEEYAKLTQHDMQTLDELLTKIQ